MKVVEFVDLYPTICEAAGLPVPKHVEGKSFMKLLHGEDKSGKIVPLLNGTMA